MVLRLRGSDAGSATANDAVTFYRLASDGNTDAVEVMHWQSYRSSLVRYVSLKEATVAWFGSTRWRFRTWVPVSSRSGL